MDDVDKLQRHEEILHRAHLEQSRRDTGDAIATGECLFCEAPLPAGMRWCGAECRDDWQREQDR
jgi:hypothetical protein